MPHKDPLVRKQYHHEYFQKNKLNLFEKQRVYENNIKKFGTLTYYLCLRSIEFGKDCLEHKISPLKGGTNEYKNLAVAHRNCNNSKYNKTEEEYRAWLAQKEDKMNGEESKDLELKQKGAIVPRVSGGTGEQKIPAGFEGLEEGDIKIARLAIGQGLSQVVIDGKAKMGELFNTISQEVYGESVEFVPLFIFKTRAQFDIERGLVMLSRDNIKVTWGKDEFEEYIDQPVEELENSQWHGKEPPLFSEVLNFPCLLANQLVQFPLCLSLMKTAYKEGLRFAGMARYTNEDFFSRVYKVSTRIEKGTKGTYALPVIEFVRRCDDTEYNIAKKWFDNLYRRKADIEVELEEEKTE